MTKMRMCFPSRAPHHLACWLQWGHPSIVGRDGHCHDWHECVYVVRGGYRVVVAGDTWVGRPGDWFLFPPGCRHAPHLDGVPESRLYVAQWSAEHLPLPDQPVHQHEGDRRLLLLLEWLASQVAGRTSSPTPLAQALWWSLVQAIAEAVAPPEPVAPGGAVEQVLRIIHEVPSNPLSLTELATLVGLSPSQLVRRFRAETGMTPMRVLRQERMRRAARLLTATDMPLRDIAREAGLSAAAHLSRLFKAEYGVSPALFRSQSRHLVAGTGPEPLRRRRSLP